MRGEEAATPAEAGTAGIQHTPELYQSDYVFHQVSPKSSGEAGQTLHLRCQRNAPKRRLRTCSLAIAVLEDRTGEVVEPDGIEPTTSCLQSTRSTN